MRRAILSHGFPASRGSARWLSVGRRNPMRARGVGENKGRQPMKLIRNLLAPILLLTPTAGVARAAAGDTTEGAAAARAEIQKTFGFVPGFIKMTPDPVLPGAWMEMKSLWLNPKTALSPKTKELIGLAVASQIPCRYCIYGHTQFARLDGASQAEVGEAVAMSALTRKWSTVLNGLPTDDAKFKSEIGQMVANAKKAAAANTPPPAPMNVVDAASAMAEIKGMFGFVPEFMLRYPSDSLAGAWTEWRDVELNPKGAIDGKSKSLISLAVASQIPCKYCVLADTEFAKLQGASDSEVAEAVAMGGMVRHWSTILNGLQIDEPSFRRDIDRLASDARKHMKVAAKD